MNILCITPIDHLAEIKKELNSLGNLKIMDDPLLEDIIEDLYLTDIIFTNPNKSKIFLGKEVLENAPNLKIICTASTGTNHIDKELMLLNNIKVLSITEERNVTNKISSTAEHALALTLASIRNIPQSFDSVKRGEWDYTPFIGRQLDSLTIGIVGLGRLGSMYARFIKPLAKKVRYYDPYVTDKSGLLERVDSLAKLFLTSDIVSLHVHVADDTIGLIDKHVLSNAKKNLLLVNTSRGEIINEDDIFVFLQENENAKYATDVLENEVNIKDKRKNKLAAYSLHNNQVLITPHIGGMTYEAQTLAYGHAVNILKKELNS